MLVFYPIRERQGGGVIRQRTQCVYFRQYFQCCSQRTRDQWELGQKAVFKVCFKKRHESRPLLICCPEVLLSSCFIWADWHVVLAPVLAYISVYLCHFSIEMSTFLKLKENLHRYHVYYLSRLQQNVKYISMLCHYWAYQASPLCWSIGSFKKSIVYDTVWIKRSKTLFKISFWFNSLKREICTS